MKCEILLLIIHCGIFHGYATAAVEDPKEEICVDNVLRGLRLHDLAETVINNKSCSESANQIFKEKYGRQAIKIYAPLKNDEPFVFYFGDRVEIHNLEIFSKILQSFGHLILNLEINHNNIDKKDAFEIGRHVMNQCSATLYQLNLVDCDLSAFIGKKSSFQNVLSVTFSGEIKHTQSETIKLNQLLPKMQRLSLELTRSSNLNIFDNEFPHLKQLSIKFIPDGNPIGLNEFLTEKLFKKNQQIRSVQLVNSDTNFLWALKDTLKPKVLKIQRLINVHSENSAENLDEPVEKISFDKLNEIEFSFRNEIELEGFIDFMESSLEKIKKLRLKQGVVNAQQLIKLARNSPNLIEASLDCAVNAMPSNITTFVQFNGKLNKLFVTTSNVKLESTKTTVQDTLSKQLGSGWVIKESDNSDLLGITIERSPPIEHPKDEVDDLSLEEVSNPLPGAVSNLSTEGVSNSSSEEVSHAPPTGSAYSLFTPSSFAWTTCLLTSFVVMIQI